MSLVGKSWRSRENASACVPLMWCLPGLKYAPENGSCICIGTFTSTPPTPSTSPVNPAKSTSTTYEICTPTRPPTSSACARGPSVLPTLILSPFQHVSRGMSSIVAWCLAGLTPRTCSASPRAPPTPGRESLPTSRTKNGAVGPPPTRSAADSGAIFSTRRYVAPDAIGTCTPASHAAKIANATEHERGRPRTRAHALRPAPSRAFGAASSHGVSTVPVRFAGRGRRGRGSRGNLRTACTRYAVTSHVLPVLANVSSMWRWMVSGPRVGGRLDVEVEVGARGT